ncbi:MAG TPA: bifunctional glutamate N-acetyltransferase/amino-acid acetyltransferase ArgJ [Actinomycetota bacterium]|nr:bifunctional glutamate N-acetyltransferase/amino-acid acetyltransferase ArgJ [Actinomycetota bacterium]
MSVTFPRGFRAAGVTAGLKESARPDLGLLAVDGEGTAAGAFTTNAFPAAPVVLSRERIARGTARAVVVNSGQANAGTGEPGLDDARATAEAAASDLRCDPEDILVCSTGLIGARIPMDKLTAALPMAAAELSENGGDAFSEAILTTDTGPKTATATAGRYRVGGCAKGAAMIAPRLAPARLATLLAFITTDAAATPELAAALVTERVVPTWNGLVVDGAQSTNDTVILLASGATGGSRIGPSDQEAAELGEAVEAVSRNLVRQVAAGAEGATRTLVVHVQGATTHDDARRVGLAVAGSPLVKAALFGADANPGRILQAIGDSEVPVEPGGVRVHIGDIPLITAGVVADPNVDVAEAMKEPEVVLDVALGDGPGTATVFGCDLGYDYVRLNAEYRT